LIRDLVQRQLHQWRKVFPSKYFFILFKKIFLFSRPFFDSKTSQNDENSARSLPSINPPQSQSDVSKQPSHDEETNPPSLLQQVGQEFNSTMAGRAVSNMAKIATNKMSELLSKYSIDKYFFNLYFI
jgi:hypothetical protein